MDDAYDVLRAYGAQQLPVPAHHWEPNHWFNQVQGVHYRIAEDGVAPEDDQMKPVVIGAIEPDLASLKDDSSAEETPVAPTGERRVSQLPSRDGSRAPDAPSRQPASAIGKPRVDPSAAAPAKI